MTGHGCWTGCYEPRGVWCMHARCYVDVYQIAARTRSLEACVSSGAMSADVSLAAVMARGAGSFDAPRVIVWQY